jgi:hypothetical protein
MHTKSQNNDTGIYVYRSPDSDGWRWKSKHRRASTNATPRANHVTHKTMQSEQCKCINPRSANVLMAGDCALQNGHNLFVPDGVERLPRSLRVAPPDVKKELPSRLFHARKNHHGSAAIQC